MKRGARLWVLIALILVGLCTLWILLKAHEMSQPTCDPYTPEMMQPPVCRPVPYAPSPWGR